MGKDGLAIAAREVDDAGIAGVDVAVGVWRVTATLMAVPVMAVLGTPMVKWLAGAAVTLILPLVMVLPLLEAVMVQTLSRVAVSNVAIKVPTPLVRVVLAMGVPAKGSLLLKETVPVKPVKTPLVLSAMTVTGKGTPAVTLLGALMAR